jgi:hypothetical protein
VSVSQSSNKRRKNQDTPYGEITASLVTSHDAASKPTLVLPPLDTLSLTDVPDVDLGVLCKAEQLAWSLSPSGPPQRADPSVGLESGDDLGCAGPPVNEVDVSATACDGEDVPGGTEGAGVHAGVLVGAERGSPQAARRTMGSAGLEVVGIVKRTGTGEQDGGTAGVEYGVRQWKGRYMERLCVRVGQAIDLAERMLGEKSRFGVQRTERT